MNHEHSPLLFCFYTMHSQTFLKIAKKVLFKGKPLKTKMIPESISLGNNAVIIALLCCQETMSQDANLFPCFLLCQANIIVQCTF